MKRYFLGMAAGYRWKDIFRHTFAVGGEKDRDLLCQYLNKRYGGETILCKNGRSALGLALKAYFEPGDAVIVNGFTCYAVFEAIKAAGLTPIFVDISQEDLNFDVVALGKLNTSHSGPRRSRPSPRGSRAKSRAAALRNAPNETLLSLPIRGIIVQNSLGNPADIVAIEKLAKKYDLTIIEDMAHCVGVKYADGRECGTVGVAAAFSFGKDKVIDTVSGGAVVFREPAKHKIELPNLRPRPSDHLRARFYPLFGGICRSLTAVHLGGLLMRGLVKIHWVEKSADNRLDFRRVISGFEAKLALRQFEALSHNKKQPIREFCLINNRNEVLKKLAKAGYYLDGLWYKQPVSPERYYKKVHFPEEKCKTAVYVAKHIINLPTNYGEKATRKAKQIIKPYLVKGGSVEQPS
ncbi:DegT/DnrJ/EryC1/StrS family aminotransferase [Candidatus Saccharibacteria bacterium]|nr:DegT/DnrJ/EryC1/StrS family aminotransferase [Candidatus Saccharibacteria bacterium]